MIIRSKLADADIAQGFTASNDIFQHKDFGLRLSDLYRNLEHGSVAILDGRWGSGKTTFVRMWVSHLKNHGTPAIYFDAFKSDYLDSPFHAVARTFIKAAKDAGKTDDPVYKTFLSKAAKVGRVVAGTAVKIGVKAATLGVISESEIAYLGDLRESISDTLSEKSEEQINEALLSPNDDDELFDSLLKSLSNLPNLLSPNNNAGSVQSPLIIVIDELDRCRPDFALGILETLKHFFRADNLHFVLVTNSDHLSLAVSHRYGIGTASREYLEKFYDFLIYFENSYNVDEPGSIKPFIKALSERILKDRTNDIRNIEDMVVALSCSFKLSLRQIESLYVNISISYLASRSGEFRPAVIVVFLVFLKALKPELFRSAKDGTLTSDDMKTLISSVKWTGKTSDNLIKHFRFYLDHNIDENSDQWRSFSVSLFNYHIERTRVIPYIANSIIDRFGVSDLPTP